MAEQFEIAPDLEIDFCSLGMFILDEIHYVPPQLSAYNVPGGAGLYATLGARLFSPAPLSKHISFILDTGSDFPPELHPLINSWETSLLRRHDSSRLTTRGWNGYDEAGTRAFKYTTPKKRIEISDIEQQYALLLSKSFHLICSPTRCINLVTKLLRARKHISPSAPKPLIIWEPAPDLCIPSELLNVTNCLPYVDICSPNHSELLALLSIPTPTETDEDFDKHAIEQASEHLLSAMPLQTYALVIRCGRHGVYIAKNGGRSRRASRRPSISSQSPQASRRPKRPPNHARGGLTPDIDMEALFADLLGAGDFERSPVPIDPGTEIWLPAVFDENGKGANMRRVVDPTGAGNSFLGGLAVGLARGRRLEEAAAWGCVAASFVVEQVGIPTLSLKNDKPAELEEHAAELPHYGAFSDDVDELWNGESVLSRLDAFLHRARGNDITS